MTTMTLTLSDFVALGSLVAAMIGPVLGYMVKIRRNDLKHLDDKLDNVQATVTRIEDRLDEHVRDHATGVFK